MASLGAIGGFLQGFTQTFQQMQRLQIEKRRAELAGREAESMSRLRAAQISRLEELKKNDEASRDSSKRAADLAEEQHLQRVSEFEANYGLGERSLGLRERQVENAEEMTDAQIAELQASGQHRQALLGISQQRFTLDKEGQAADIAARTRGQDIQVSQFGQSFGLQGKEFSLRRKKVEADIGAQDRSQALQERSLESQESQFDRSLAADKEKTASAAEDRSRRTSLAQRGVEQGDTQIANDQARLELGILQDQIDNISLTPEIARTASMRSELTRLRTAQQSIMNDMAGRSAAEPSAPRASGVAAEESRRAGSQAGPDEVIIHAPPLPTVQPDLTDEEAEQLEAVNQVSGALEAQYGKTQMVGGTLSYVVSDDRQAAALRDSPLYPLAPRPILTTQQVRERSETERIDAIDTMNEAGESLFPVVNNIAMGVARSLGLEFTNEAPSVIGITMEAETSTGKSTLREGLTAKGEQTTSRTTELTSEMVPRLHIGDVSNPDNLHQLATVINEINRSGMSGDTQMGWYNLVADQGADTIETALTLIPEATEPIAGSLTDYRYKPYSKSVSKPVFNTVNELVKDARKLSHPTIGQDPIARFRDAVIDETSMDFRQEISRVLNQLPLAKSVHAGGGGPGSRGVSRKSVSPADVNRSVKDREEVFATTITELATAFESERAGNGVDTRHAVQTIRDSILLLSPEQQQALVSHKVGGTVNPGLVKALDVIKEMVGIEVIGTKIPQSSTGNLLINGRSPRRKQILPFDFINLNRRPSRSVGGKIQ